MQRKISFKFHKKNLCILILFVMIYSMVSFIPQLVNKSYAATYTYSKSKKDVPSNFDSTYPGYKSLLESLVKAHPNWTFELYETGLDWKVVIDNEYSSLGRNLSPKNYPDGWICPICKDVPKDNGSWRCASEEAVKYMIDPRNSMNADDIFQFLKLSNDKKITENQVRTMASKISYLNTDKIIAAIYNAAQDLDINPFYIIGKISQEQGSNGSVLCAGNGYKGQYVGYYNLFNVRTSGNSNDEVILNGLKYAYDKGWNTPEKSIKGGLSTIKEYIDAKQDTLYFQKFDVIGPYYYTHQYAQNVLDAQVIGEKLRDSYIKAKLLESSFTFKIPLYKNMPATACTNPTKLGVTVKGELAYINANNGLLLRTSQGYNGKEIATISKNEKVLIIEEATKKVDGIYWDKVYTHSGTGYMARAASDGSKTYLVTEKEQQAQAQKYKISGSNIIVAPDATIKTISGAKNTSSVFGTGAKITLEGKTYNLVMLGDANGDGKITPADYVKVKNKIMGVSSMNGISENAADANKDGKITPADYVKIKNHIMKASRITI